MKEKNSSFEESTKPRYEYLPTGRGLEDYLKNLRLTKEDLEKKVILDIGAGARKFAKDIEDEKIDAEVYSLDPYYAFQDKSLEKVINKNKSPGVQKKTVAAAGDRLPFRNETFDLVLSDFALPFYSASRRELKDFFSEVRRVVKPGGEIRIYPLKRLGDTLFGLARNIFVDWEIIKLKTESEFLTEKDAGLLIIKKKIPNEKSQ